MTKWTPELEKTGRPKFRLLADAIERDVYAGTLNPGDRLPTHRDLADDLKMNVSTITRGYAEAEKRGLVCSTVGRGTFIAPDATTSTPMVSFEPHARGMIEMGLVNTFYDLDPDLNEAMQRLTRRRNLNTFLRYTDPQGLPEHRETGAEWIGRYGMEVEPDDVLICSGAQHALSCCLGSLFRAGDRIAADSLTYPGMKTLASMLGIKLIPVQMDEQGMIPEALDTACRRGKINGIYLMPGVQNPTTACMSLQRRIEIAHTAGIHGLTLIEDDAYALTKENVLPPVSSFLRESSVHIAGVSKTVAVGLRVAFMSAKGEMKKQLAYAILNSIWVTPPINAELICNWIKDGTAQKTMLLKRAAARERFAAVRDMTENMELCGNPDGFFAWLKLPEPWRGNMLERRAREAGINIFAAEKFAVGDCPVPPMIRLSLSGPRDITQLRQGLERLKNIIENQ
ncbi:PLP-dependent aminotransferase family protein [Maridesulfovibrio sp.]|uniref:aminotransferase-like domain-containing protein n=1 Tax=Maridesulfovibrio sp. TaxID=2795000 RepID=UPI002A18A7EE|nr:PLP-dependent aminotransferase family protein [Maridesulfovibrio sp.]